MHGSCIGMDYDYVTDVVVGSKAYLDPHKRRHSR